MKRKVTVLALLPVAAVAMAAMAGLAKRAVAASPEPGKVNASCSQMICENALKCVKTREGDMKCATCSQSDLDGYTRNVDALCKTIGKGWAPENNAEYVASKASDGNVWVEVFDSMLDKAKACKSARVLREKECWNGGDDEHKNAIGEVDESIERIAKHKSTMIDGKNVYYCQPNTYKGRLSTFESKCRSDYNNHYATIDQKLTIYLKDLSDSKTVPCAEVEGYGNDSERCADAAKELISDGFSGSSYKTPYKPYGSTYEKARDLKTKAKEVYDSAKSKNLCN